MYEKLRNLRNHVVHVELQSLYLEEWLTSDGTFYGFLFWRENCLRCNEDSVIGAFCFYHYVLPLTWKSTTECLLFPLILCCLLVFGCPGICQCISELNDTNLLCVCFYCSFLFRRTFVGKRLWESKDERKWGHDKFEEITVQDQHYEEVKTSSSCLIVELLWMTPFENMFTKYLEL